MNSDPDLKSKQRTVKFPHNRVLGKLFVRQRSEAGWLSWVSQSRKLKEATGEVKVPNDCDLCLYLNRDEIGDLSPLLALDPDDLQALIFPLASPNNDALFYIQR